MLTSRPSMVAASLSALFGLGSLAGCDLQDEDIGAIEAERFYNGIATDSEGGGFRVVLSARDTLITGKNGLIVHVGFHDPADLEAPGKGIPEAEVELDAHMPYSAAYAHAGAPVYLGEGDYLFQDLTFAESGVWSLDLAIAVGESMDESAHFSFIVPALGE